MELERALHQISEIHDHLARSEVYRGYRSLPIAVAGVVAIVAAALQATLLPAADGLDFVRYWVVIAALCGALCSADIVYNHLFREDAFRRRGTRRVVAQFLPCIVAGAVITWCLARDEPLIPLLPGLWALLFALGVLASRPYLPRATGWVGLLFVACGAGLLAARGSGVPSPWTVGLPFGGGLLLAALVHHYDIERADA